ncbi:MAG: outer membrane protein assembly factor BamA [Bacteroidales bacterium]|nr:outer membrane protein assembly factor BamA [Bacteroidales bacterium]
MREFFVIIYSILLLFSVNTFAQVNLGEDTQVDYSYPKVYELGGITIAGSQNLDNNIIISLSGLTIGDNIEIPGDKITKAVNNLWKQGLFEDVKIYITRLIGNTVFIEIYIEEKPRLSKFAFKGIKKAEATKLKDKIKLTKGDVVTEHLIMTTSNSIKNFFSDKGYINTTVNIIQKVDTTNTNNVILNIIIDKKYKVKINLINIEGNSALSDNKIKRTLKKTKEKKLSRIFTASKYDEKLYNEDKLKVIAKYNELGYRDAKIIKDSVYRFNDKRVNIDLILYEGPKYFLRNLSWVGNTKFSDNDLSTVLKLKKGDIYNEKKLEANLYMNPDGQDISSLYLDDGYLFFNVTPVEVNVENDSIDIEFRIYEGKQARIKRVYITGNTKTNDRVVLREIRSKPGDLFNRSDIIRSQRELAQLKYFNSEKIAINPKPNALDGTVDIEYAVEETSSDQVELSGGWGGGRIVGTLGLSFNNFSMKNIAKKDAWRPLPSGDGQKLSLRAQSNGRYYQSYSASFTEPWLGGKKPNSFSVTLYHSVQTNGLLKNDEDRQAIYINGVSLGLGKRVKWPDDFFSIYHELSFQHYELDNYYSVFSFGNGFANNLSYNAVVGRNSIDAPIFARSGSNISLSVKATPPYSLFNNIDYKTASDQQKYKWLEYHKWNFNTSWFTKLAGNLVLNTRTKFGFLGMYNRNIGIAPFERYYVGGDGLSGYAIDGREIIALRGYTNYSLTPQNAAGYQIGGSIFNKYTFELRYPISLNPMATIFVLGFAEAGNAWSKFSQFNAFNIKRSAGFGVRIFLPMFGLLGLDWGYGFDKVPGSNVPSKGQFHFSIGQSIE